MDESHVIFELKQHCFALYRVADMGTYEIGVEELRRTIESAVFSSPQQQDSPQQTSQRTSMRPQLSYGTIHPPMSSGNQDGAYPPSRQLSSQTMGSVSSMANSPMDMQGVNKSS
nr:Spt20 family [Tanacetum cinerariifolium]